MLKKIFIRIMTKH